MWHAQGNRAAGPLVSDKEENDPTDEGGGTCYGPGVARFSRHSDISWCGSVQLSRDAPIAIRERELRGVPTGKGGIRAVAALGAGKKVRGIISVFRPGSVDETRGVTPTRTPLASRRTGRCGLPVQSSPDRTVTIVWWWETHSGTEGRTCSLTERSGSRSGNLAPRQR